MNRNTACSRKEFKNFFDCNVGYIFVYRKNRDTCVEPCGYTLLSASSRKSKKFKYVSSSNSLAFLSASLGVYFTSTNCLSFSVPNLIVIEYTKKPKIYPRSFAFLSQTSGKVRQRT